MTKIRSIMLLLAALAISVAMPLRASAEDITISNAGGLRSFRDEVNAGDDFAGKTIILAADIDLADEDWVPIGTNETPFAGKFNGGNHTISGLNMTDENAQSLTLAGAAGKGTGLFLHVSGDGAQIANLTVSGSINCAAPGSMSAVGGIAAYLGHEAVIYRCLSNVDVILGGAGGERESYAYAGGVAGYSEGHVIYCVNEGTVTASPERIYTMAGGIVGEQHDGSILFSDNSGEITIPDIGGYMRGYAGGIAGSIFNGSMSSVRNQAAVTSYNLAGGITAYAMNSVLRDAVNVAAVSGTWSGSDITVGGIVAQLHNGSSAVNCYNTGEVTAGGSSSYAYAGGIIGWSSAGFSSSNKIYNCTNIGNVSGSASASARVGGIVGDLDKTELHSSVNSGAVSANSPYVPGGIAGYKSADANIHDVAYSGDASPIGYGSRNMTDVELLSEAEIKSFVVTSFPSLDPAIVWLREGNTKTVGVKLHTHPGSVSDEGVYYSLSESYVEPDHASASASDDTISLTGTSPGVSLLAAYVDTYRSGGDGTVDTSASSRSLVTALVWVAAAESEDPSLPENPEIPDEDIDIPAGPGDSSSGDAIPPLWPDVPLPQVPEEPDTDKDWNERYPSGSGGGGCSAGWCALTLLAVVPLALRRRK